MADSPHCDVCGHVETVEHHLVLCRNAQRVWTLYNQVTGESVTSLFDVISFSRNKGNEIIKSTLLKALIQIDRSKDSNGRELLAKCVFFLTIEARASATSSNLYLDCARRLRSFF